MQIKEIQENKKEYLKLLLIGDEQESMIDTYIDGTMYVLFDADARAVCIVKQKYPTVLEIKNLAVYPEYQNRGYGKQAVELALRFIRTFPCGKADFCWLSYEPENAVAKSLYAPFGFIETGEKDGEELIAVLKL